MSAQQHDNLTSDIIRRMVQVAVTILIQTAVLKTRYRLLSGIW